MTEEPQLFTKEVKKELVKEKPKEESFIQRFVDICKPYCDSPEVFLEASGHYIISWILGRYFESTWIPKPGRPNLWILLSSIPGRMRRSSLYGYVDFVERKVLFTLLKEQKLLENEQLPDGEKKKISDRDIQRELDDLIIEEGTPEGIMDAIDETDSKNYAIKSPEFGGVFVKISDKHYEAGTGILFSKFYYGEGGSMLLSRRGGKKGLRRIPPGLYVVMFCGMQEPRYYLSKKMVRQGLLRRLLIVYVPAKTGARYIPPINQMRAQIFVDLNKLVNDLILRAHEIQKCLNETGQKFIDVRFWPTVTDEINKFDEKLARKVDVEPTDTNLYKQSFWEHLGKLTMCQAIEKNILAYDEHEHKYFILISPNNYKKAKDFFDRATANVDEWVQSLGIKPITTVKSQEDVFEMILGHIQRSMPTGIPKWKLLNKIGLLAGELDKYLETLTQQKKIMFEMTIPTGPGRPGRVFKIREKEEE